jgi:hypothetical protein
LSVLKGAPQPQSAAGGEEAPKLWLPNPNEYKDVRKEWVSNWNQIFNYRQ